MFLFIKYFVKKVQVPRLLTSFLSTENTRIWVFTGIAAGCRFNFKNLKINILWNRGAYTFIKCIIMVWDFRKSCFYLWPMQIFSLLQTIGEEWCENSNFGSFQNGDISRKETWINFRWSSQNSSKIIVRLCFFCFFPNWNFILNISFVLETVQCIDHFIS